MPCADVNHYSYKHKPNLIQYKLLKDNNFVKQIYIVLFFFFKESFECICWDDDAGNSGLFSGVEKEFLQISLFKSQLGKWKERGMYMLLNLLLMYQRG